jgi:hypothetical protein
MGNAQRAVTATGACYHRQCHPRALPPRDRCASTPETPDIVWVPSQRPTSPPMSGSEEIILTSKRKAVDDHLALQMYSPRLRKNQIFPRLLGKWWCLLMECRVSTFLDTSSCCDRDKARGDWQGAARYFRESLSSTASLAIVCSTAPKASRWPMQAARSLSILSKR